MTAATDEVMTIRLMPGLHRIRFGLCLEGKYERVLLDRLQDACGTLDRGADELLRVLDVCSVKGGSSVRDRVDALDGLVKDTILYRISSCRIVLSERDEHPGRTVVMSSART
jgi:hypothetical protein